MDMDNGVGIDCGRREAGWRRAKGKKWDNCNRTNKNKKIKVETQLKCKKINK